MPDIPENVSNLVLEKLRRLETKIDALHDEMNVQGAMILRMDGTLRRILDELAAMHEQSRGFDQRLRKLEDVQG